MSTSDGCNSGVVVQMSLSTGEVGVGRNVDGNTDIRDPVVRHILSDLRSTEKREGEEKEIVRWGGKSGTY